MRKMPDNLRDQAILVAAIEQVLELSKQQEKIGADTSTYHAQLQDMTLRLIKMTEDKNG
jgi:hypothetical protein